MDVFSAPFPLFFVFPLHYIANGKKKQVIPPKKRAPERIDYQGAVFNISEEFNSRFLCVFLMRTSLRGNASYFSQLLLLPPLGTM